ncbi:MAG: DinB family protein [Bryobacteraceae bacterium]
MYQGDLNLFRSVRVNTLKVADGLDQNQLDFSPAARRWSVGEVLDHLLLSELHYRRTFTGMIELVKSGKRPVITHDFRDLNTSLRFIPKAFLPFLGLPFTIFNMFVPSMVREMMTEFRALPVTNPDIAEPRKGRPAAELRAALRSSFAETEALFEANPTLDYRRMRYQYPLLGDNNALQILRILALHEKRHHAQIMEVLRARGFPKRATAA